jgi:uncharacterized membrane protein YeiB
MHWADLLFIALVGGSICAALANRRGRGIVRWSVLGFLFPILAIIVILIMPNLKKEAEKAAEKAEAEAKEIAKTTKLCPFCAETIREKANICRFCNSQLHGLSE